MKRGWPRSLHGRLVLILVGGMLASQLLTSSIWYEVRQTQVLEIPLRLLAGRLADLLQVARERPAQLPALLEGMASSRWQQLPAAPTGLAQATPEQDALLRRLLSERTGAPAPLRLLHLQLLAPDNQPGGAGLLMRGAPASVRSVVELTLPDGQVLYLQSTEDQGWRSASIGSLVFDFLFRIYLLRTVVVVLLALIAVRIALRPLRQMAAAAEALGQDIHRPPLSLDGPQEVRQAAQAFNAMQQRLIDSIAERTRFFAAVSHDLRTPITRLRLRTELLPQENMRQRFRADLQQMEDMVAASLDFLRSGELENAREPVDIDALLRALQADFEDLGGELRLHGQARPLSAHASGLRRCLQNLLDNAHRHAPGPVDIEVQDSPERLRIQVGDRGPGIDGDHLAQVLEPFYQVDPSRSGGGHGLGLSIAAGIANAHGGSLTLGPRLGGGLLVTVDLPRAGGA
ncbi:ATP-binding protein [Pseudomonas sichuanensis]|uniref:ATP-binding protein n=1 Tax=Pseudomonas sichuanensis TaxID=2213015 RepID=UPI002447AE3D|nr:ATP-binding protein [Pseudomonas sichuanensis]MDH0733248.1 ATP-binding protein [Pseudomonas sichuanensis]MDH1594320.1 ATP-binding protein [Pseudomonas sichuanensis]MDH1598327.1 ATP-binding protein [Pseudomonas sichuanensis]